MKESIGIEIGSAAVRAARVSLSRQPQFEAFHQVPLPAEAVRDGEIVDSEPVEKAVAQAVKGVGGAKTVTVAVANQKVVARIAELPHIDEKELRGAIRYQVQDLIPIPLESAVLDFVVLQEFTNEDQDKMIRVLVVAAHKDMINSFLETIERAGFSADAVDFTPLALMRSLGRIQRSSAEQNGGGEALIDVGAELTCMVVRQKEIPRLARVLAVGANQEPATLVDEIRGSIKFYTGQSEDGAISRVVLSGEAQNLEEIAPLLSDGLDVPVEVGSSLSSIKSSQKAIRQVHGQRAESVVAVALGAALGAMDS